MTAAQLLAGGIAVALVVLFVAGTVRWRMPATTVIFLLLTGVPTAGFADYAVSSGPEPDLRIAGILTIILYATGAAALVFIRLRRHKGRPTIWYMASDSRRFLVALIVRWLLILWIGSLLFLFEPEFALAYLLVNLLWMVVWLPARFRTSTRTTITDFAAPPKRVFDVVSDVRNWKLYRDDVELLSVTPDGPLVVGSEYVARVAIPDSLRRSSYRGLEARYQITSLVPGKSFDTMLVGQQSLIRTNVEPTNNGARMSRSVKTITGLLRAWSADVFNSALADGAVRAREERNWARLKAFLEAAPEQ